MWGRHPFLWLDRWGIFCYNISNDRDLGEALRMNHREARMTRYVVYEAVGYRVDADSPAGAIDALELVSIEDREEVCREFELEVLNLDSDDFESA